MGKKLQIKALLTSVNSINNFRGINISTLNSDRTCNAVISHLPTGAVDGLDKEETHPLPLSRRLKSESTSSYVQGRLRLPLLVITSAFNQLRETLFLWLQEADAVYFLKIW